MTLVISESCTGGGISFALSKSKICSPLLERGFITYSNQAKQHLLNVKIESIELHGAVSKIIAEEMAEGALKNSLAQASLAITGIAGEDNPSNNYKGVAWLGVAIIDSKSMTQKVESSGSRKKFLDNMVYEALLFLYTSLKNSH